MDQWLIYLVCGQQPRGAGARVHLEQLERGADIIIDGDMTDAEPGPDLLGGIALADEAQAILLAVGQTIDSGRFIEAIGRFHERD
jgi:hypothetical protein